MFQMLPKSRGQITKYHQEILFLKNYSPSIFLYAIVLCSVCRIFPYLLGIHFSEKSVLDSLPRTRPVVYAENMVHSSDVSKLFVSGFSLSSGWASDKNAFYLAFYRSVIFAYFWNRYFGANIERRNQVSFIVDLDLSSGLHSVHIIQDP